MHNTEDKQWWCQAGQRLEKEFVTILTTKLNIPAIINPEKIKNKYAPDLLVNNKLSDLKTQNTPFFSARQYGLDPQWAVTFNRKDYERYKKLYPKIFIFFWIEWKQTSMKLGVKNISVEYLCGIYLLKFEYIVHMIEMGAPEHSYQRRINDPHNANSSFILDVRKFDKLYQITSLEEQNE